MNFDSCEIYVWENIDNVVDVVGAFTKVCKFLLDKGVRKFQICNKNNSTNLCYEILNQYKCNYSKIDVVIRTKQYNPKNIKGYAVMFNYDGLVVFYNSDIYNTYNFIKEF